MSHPLAPVFVLVCCSILWGISWLPLKALNRLGLDGVPMIFVSHLVLALLLTPRALARFRADQPSALNKRALLGIALLGGVAIMCFTYALTYGEVIRVMVLFYLLPVWGVLGGRIFLHERIDRWRWFGVVAAVIGAFLILGGVRVFDQAPTWIDILALLSGLCFAANNMCFRAFDTIALETKVAAMFYGCAALGAVLLAFGVQAWPSDAGVDGWGWLALYTLTWLLVANIGSQWAVTQMEAGRSSIIIIIELLAAVISALLVGGETLSPSEWFGCALVVCAAFVEARRSQ